MPTFGEELPVGQHTSIEDFAAIAHNNPPPLLFLHGRVNREAQRVAAWPCLY